MTRFLEVWVQVASTLMGDAIGASVSFALAGSNSAVCDMTASGAEFTGVLQGRFVVRVQASALELLKESRPAAAPADWPELFERITAEAAAELASERALPVHCKSIPQPIAASVEGSSYTVEVGGHAIPIHIIDQTREMLVNLGSDGTRKNESSRELIDIANGRGMDLLLDVELEASLRFGSREMPLSQVVELGPGDVVQLDRHISDPVDLVVGDKIVARGEVVLVNGNFGLRITEVAEPQKRLESIRCLF